MHKQHGFTLVEVVTIIVVVAALLAIALLGVGRFLADSRDTQRATRAAIIAEALEKYYDKNGEYPGCGTLTTPAETVTAGTGPLAGVSADALLTPQAASGETNSIECDDLTSLNDPDVFSYVGDGSSGCAADSSCGQFTLKYKSEIENTITSIESRRHIALSSVGAPVLSTTGADFNAISLSWTETQNTSDYQVQADTTTDFTSSNLQSSTITGTSHTVGSLSPGQQYFFRVAATRGGEIGEWSNIVDANTLQVATPTGLATTPNSSTQITVSWNPVSAPVAATSYSLRYSTSSSMSSPTTISSISGTSRAVAGLSVGTTYYFQVQAVAGAQQSAWSSPVSGIPIVPAPSCASATTNSPTQITVNWCAVPGATSYTIQYSTSSSFASFSTLSDVTGTSRAVTGLQQGTTWYFRVIALIGSASSSPSSVASATTTINGPSSVGWSVWYNCCHSGPWMPGGSPGAGSYWYGAMSATGSCPSGSTLEVYIHSWYENYSISWTTGHIYVTSYGNTTWYRGGPTDYVAFEGWMRCIGPNATSGTYTLWKQRV